MPATEHRYALMVYELTRLTAPLTQGKMELLWMGFYGFSWGTRGNIIYRVLKLSMCTIGWWLLVENWTAFFFLLFLRWVTFHDFHHEFFERPSARPVSGYIKAGAVIVIESCIIWVCLKMGYTVHPQMAVIEWKKTHDSPCVFFPFSPESSDKLTFLMVWLYTIWLFNSLPWKITIFMK